MKQNSLDAEKRPKTHLFIVRVWIEHLSDGKAEWRGKVQHVLSGEVRFFGDWQVLQQFIKAHSNSRANDAQPSNQEDV